MFRGRDHKGRVIKLSDFSSYRTILLFASETCTSCQEVIDQLSKVKKWSGMKLLIISREEYQKKRFEMDEYASYIQSNEITDMYYVKKNPYSDG